LVALYAASVIVIKKEIPYLLSGKLKLNLSWIGGLNNPIQCPTNVLFGSCSLHSVGTIYLLQFALSSSVGVRSILIIQVVRKCYQKMDERMNKFYIYRDN
jgi:hypothetical protein